MSDDALDDALLWGLPVEAIRAALAAADGQELASGKLASPQSSSALALNAFGPFLARPAALPPLPGTEALGWPALSVRVEAKLRFPWRGGRHPNLDVLVETREALIGIESKRYESFDPHGAPAWSEAYWRHDWGPAMRGACALRDASRDGTDGFLHIEAAQLVKHAFGLWTATAPGGFAAGKAPVLVHLRAEPREDRRGRPIAPATLARLAEEVARFGTSVAGDRVRFVGLRYRDLLEGWRASAVPQLRAHAAALDAFFAGDL